jgi:Protein of unknown function (DUF1194)
MAIAMIAIRRRADVVRGMLGRFEFSRLMGRVLRLCAALAFMAALGETASTETQQVDLQLILAVDASGSVNQERFELQKQGYAEAFRNPRVLRAIQSGRNQSIAVTMVQWTGPFQQVVVVPWLVVRDQATAEIFAGEIAKTERRLYSGGTSISGAIDFCVMLMPTSPYKGLKRTIDISGDGSNNRGRSVTEARDEAVRAGININGLPILALEPNLDRYYYDNVIGGPGAIMVPAANYDAFAEAIIKKLINEIASDTRFPLAEFAGSIHR